MVLQGHIHSIKEEVKEGINAYLVEFPNQLFYVSKIASDIPLYNIGDPIRFDNGKVMLNGSAIYSYNGILNLKNFEETSREFNAL
ncbi:hypothetical protein AB4K01_16360 [Serratia fonticola]|uniref:hypothetical protein n=1 Tax=Serratia fonticola TaxID=47917 RepID=UPI0034C6D33A